MQIYLARNNIQAGPYTLEQFNQILATDQLLPTDLMWHDGMTTWQSVATTLQGQTHYTPLDNEESHIINNRPTANEANPNKKPQDSVWDKYNANNPHKNHEKTQTSKQTPRLFGKSDRSNRGMDIAHGNKQLVLASVGSRILAKLIDVGVLILAALPLTIAIINSPMFEKLKKIAESGATQLTSAQQSELLATVPHHILVLTNVLVWGILFLQMLLLTKRGQTLGKIAMGIRVLDLKSNAMPSFLNLIVLRGIFPLVVYLMSPVGFVFLLVDFIAIFMNNNRQSLHDKLAKTYVVVADDTQTNPLKLNPSK
ncbi:RDD domain-containing protein [Moraxella macacae 0408225]|uniref:RDD domain-containing protein n=1 Tax=Moraxella macacae 0408225 TaxID=1230338 RepID=L2F717_9GAMM|nr:RDD family protein [Moraxella macacae]ELA08248.1 RDD domain-containing protein [Moraxella macacae 0408225]